MTGHVRNNEQKDVADDLDAYDGCSAATDPDGRKN
jgi:hypothetical protein